MKKIIIVVIILFILLFPVKATYKDGGTTEYKALLYRVIKWNKIQDFGEFKTGTEVFYFPNNFHQLDYYDEPRPPKIAIYSKEDEMNDLIICNTGSYIWSKTVGKETISVTADAISPTSMKYSGTLKTNKFVIYTTNELTVSHLTLYINDKTKWYELSKEQAIKLTYNKLEKSIDFTDIEKGNYILVIDVKEDSNTAWYSCSIEIE